MDEPSGGTLVFGSGEIALLIIGGVGLVLLILGLVNINGDELWIFPLVIGIIACLIGFLGGFIGAADRSHTLGAQHDLKRQGFTVKSVDTNERQAVVSDSNGCRMIFKMDNHNGWHLYVDDNRKVRHQVTADEVNNAPSYC